MDEFLATHAVIMVADHAQTAVTEAYEMIEALAAEWRVLQPSSDNPESAELAISPTSRAGHIYVLVDQEREAACHADVRKRLHALDGTDLVGWLAAADGEPIVRRQAGSPLSGDSRVEAVIETERGELRFRPGPGGKTRPSRAALAPRRRPGGARPCGLRLGGG